MTTLTLFEHETLPLPLSARQLALLAQLQQRLGEKVLQLVPRGGALHLRAGQYVGVVRLGTWTIQILPKIYKASDLSEEARARAATANLLHMLAYAGILKVRESEVSDLLSRESDWFEILTYIFARHLHEEWQRGPTRSYEVVEDDLPLLKGKWRLNEQLRRPERAHRFAVAYDEFTTDIPLNRIFRFVVERLGRLTRSSQNARLLGALRETLDDVALVPVATVEEADRVVFTRLNARYEPLRNLARLFLDGGALQTASGDTSLFAFVFDMNAVFEGFIAGFLQRYRATALPAVLIDADNAQAAVIEGLLAEVARFGEATVKRIYGDFTSTTSAQWKKVLNQFAIKPVQQFAYTSGKNATDSTLIIDAMDLLYTRRFDGFCLVSSDSNFTGLALRIREEGLMVYGFGEQKTPEAFRNACHRFVFTEVLRLATASVAESESAAGSRTKAAISPSTQSKGGATTTLPPVVSAPTSAPATPVPATPAGAQSSHPAAEFPTALFRQALEQSSDEQGWAHLGLLGSHLTKLRSDFDARNFGYRKLSDLVRARPDLFDIDEREVTGSPTKNLYIRAK